MMNNGRIIINNRSSLPDDKATMLVVKVMSEGRVSNCGKQYCYASLFAVPDGKKVVVISSLNKGSDSFIVCDHGDSNE